MTGDGGQPGGSQGTGKDTDMPKDIPARESSNMIKLSKPLDEFNWTIWKEHMKLALCLCRLVGYAKGKIKCPDNPLTANGWNFEDTCAQFLIINNITMGEMVHISQCTTTQCMWLNLKAIHETKSHYTAITHICNLLHTIADEDTNVGDHLMNMKRCWEKINLISNDNFKLPDLFFKVIIALSLPSSWDAFTNPFVRSVQGEEEKDPKKLMFSQEFIGILKEESTWCQGCAQMESTNQVFGNKSNLIKRLGVSLAKGKCAPATTECMFCCNCRWHNHNTPKCHYLGADKCNQCGHFGHLGKHCWRRSNNGPHTCSQKWKMEQTQMQT